MDPVGHHATAHVKEADVRNGLAQGLVFTRLRPACTWKSVPSASHDPRAGFLN